MGRPLRQSALAPLLTATLALLLATAPAVRAQDETSDAELTDSFFGPELEDQFARGFDAVILRPLGFVSLVVGAAAFVPAAIMSSPGGRPSVETAFDVFVRTPKDSVFERSLGDF